MKASSLLIGILFAAVGYLYLTKKKPVVSTGSSTSGSGKAQVGVKQDDFQAGAALFTQLIQSGTTLFGGKAQTGPSTSATPADATPASDDIEV